MDSSERQGRTVEEKPRTGKKPWRRPLIKRSDINRDTQTLFFQPPPGKSVP